jgi:hypothetical protein
VHRIVGEAALSVILRPSGFVAKRGNTGTVAYGLCLYERGNDVGHHARGCHQGQGYRSSTRGLPKGRSPNAPSSCRPRCPNHLLLVPCRRSAAMSSYWRGVEQQQQEKELHRCYAALTEALDELDAVTAGGKWCISMSDK